MIKILFLADTHLGFDFTLRPRKDRRRRGADFFANFDRANSQIKFLCMHQSIEGAVVGPADYTFRNGKDVIPINYIPDNYNLILSGHIHRSQILWTLDKKTPIIYPGSIERTSFAEKDEEKGFYLIEINEDYVIDYKFIGLPARQMVDIALSEKLYTKEPLRIDILEKISNISEDSILRFKMMHLVNLNMLTARFLDEILPWTMNYQLADSFSK